MINMHPMVANPFQFSALSPLFTWTKLITGKYLTKYRLNDHKLAKKEYTRKSWQPKQNTKRSHCSTGESEAKMHLILKCITFNEIKNICT